MIESYIMHPLLGWETAKPLKYPTDSVGNLPQTLSQGKIQISPALRFSVNSSIRCTVTSYDLLKDPKMAEPLLFETTDALLRHPQVWTCKCICCIFLFPMKM